MNRSLLHDLQQMRGYPSITILLNTQPGTAFGNDDLARVQRLVGTVRERLDTLIDDDPTPLIETIEDLIGRFQQPLAGIRKDGAAAFGPVHEDANRIDRAAVLMLGGSGGGLLLE